MTENNLHILSVNCRSMYTKLLELKLLIYNKKPHIICLSETWAVADRLPTFVNYNSTWKNRAGNRGGGIAIITRSDVVALPKALNHIQSDLECMAVTITSGTKLIDIII